MRASNESKLAKVDKDMEETKEEEKKDKAVGGIRKGFKSQHEENANMKKTPTKRRNKIQRRRIKDKWLHIKEKERR